MRLTTYQQQAIKQSVQDFLPDAKIFLYGSRADDSKRGGDIDLLILSQNYHDRSIELKVLAALYKKIGEQKIDLLIENPDRLSDFAKLINLDAIPI